MPPSSPLRRELLFALGFLFIGALLLGTVGLSTLLPVFESPTEALVYVVILFGVDLAVVFAFAGSFLRGHLVRPIEGLVEDVRRIADGDHEHRVGAMPNDELRAIEEHVNSMADHLMRDRRLLADNVRSLDETNQALLEANSHVVRSAHLASVGALAAGIAHEVGNPLGAILGYVDVVRARAGKAGADTEIFDAIRAEASRIDRIVRTLLDYARPADGSAGPADPAVALDRVRGLLEAQGRLDGIAVEWDSGDGDLPCIDTEAQRLEQILVNLVLNAVDALEGVPDPAIRASVSSEPGGAHRLPRRREADPPEVNYMHRRRLAADDGGLVPHPLFTARRVIVIRVQDNGGGIPEENLDSVFDPFFTTKEPGKGTGLGLFVCARLVESMGGSIDVVSAEGGGAEFTVRLPGARAAQEDA